MIFVGLAEKWEQQWQMLQATEGPTRWVIGVLMVLFLLGLGELLLRVALHQLRALSRRTTSLSDDHLVSRLRIPSRGMLVAGSLHIGAIAAGLTWPIDGLLLAEGLLLTFMLVESAETLLVDLVLQDRLGIRVPGLLRQVAIGVVYTGVVLGVAGHISGMDITPLLATTSVASLVLGLALQQPLSNLFAGLILHLDRPFKEQDWILVGTREGQILELGWRSTRLRMLSGDVLILPNNTLLGAEIQNFSAPDTVTSRLIDLAVSPRVPPRDLERWVGEAAATIDGALAEPPPQTWLVRMEPTIHHYQIKLWIRDFPLHDRWESALRVALWYRLRDEGYPLLLETPVRVLSEKPSEKPTLTE
jgi:small-conductance mechanosensitive channel